MNYLCNYNCKGKEGNKELTYLELLLEDEDDGDKGLAS
jgi:hypothetical protein